MAAPVDRTAAFRALHEAGCFVIPNPWDVGSARYLEMLGFKALATTSSGFAWTLGRSDTRVTLDEVLGAPPRRSRARWRSPSTPTSRAASRSSRTVSRPT